LPGPERGHQGRYILRSPTVSVNPPSSRRARGRPARD
jgi:hypothetical protein